MGLAVGSSRRGEWPRGGAGRAAAAETGTSRGREGAEETQTCICGAAHARNKLVSRELYSSWRER